MRSRTKLLLSAFVVALALSAAVSTAQARRFQLSNQHFLAIWEVNEKLTFSAAGFFNIACKVTIEGSFHSATLSKVCGQLVGYVTEAEAERPCVGGEAWVLNGIERLSNGTTTTNTLPWHIRYNSFTGTLPNITGIRLQLIGASFLIRAPVNNGCLIKTTEARPAFGIVEREAGGNVTGLRAEEVPTIPTLVVLEGICAAGSFAGKARVFLQSESAPILEQTKIVVRLVQ
jgi:hypothetical protein